MNDRELLQKAVDALVRWYVHPDEQELIETIRERLAQPEQEPVAWVPISTPFPMGNEVDILMGDGSILCAAIPQADGDFWWDGSGVAEMFIDPEFDDVTHWRLHQKPQPAQKPLTEEMITAAARELCKIHAGECQIDEQDTWKFYSHQFKRDAQAAIEAAHVIKGEE